MEAPDVIAARDLTKYYGSHLGIKDVSFDVKAGEIFGFLGPNGAGKTTTIRILLDLLRPDSGRVELLGLDIKNQSIDIRKEVGYLPGDFPAFGYLSILGLFRLLSKIRQFPLEEDSPLFRRFDLSEHDLKRKLKALSHGTLQKVGIIQALIHRPRLLILDEPTTGLDPLMQEVVYEILSEEQSRGTSILFSSHNLDEVEKLCDRVAIIRKGRIAGLESVEVMKAKAGQIVECNLQDPLPEIDIPGADLIRQQGARFTFRFRGDINILLNQLSGFNVKDLSISKPDLNELFLDYYQDQNRTGSDIS